MKVSIQLPPPIVFIVFGLLLFSGGYKYISKRLSTLQSPQARSIESRRSMGENLLISADVTPDKQAGIQAVVKGKRKQAIDRFRASLAKHPNDPETVIYLNNANVQNPSFRIATSIPISSNLNVAQEILRGVAQAQDEVNQAGGIHGKGLQVEIIDDENEPDIVQQVATELVRDRNILAVVGHNSSDASLVAAPIYQEGGLVMISPTSTATQLSSAGSYIFRSVPSNRLTAEPLAQYAIEILGKTHFAICYDSQVPSNLSFRDEFATAVIAKGATLVPTICDEASPTFNPTTVVSQSISSGADALLILSHIDRLERGLEIARANKGRLSVFADSSFYTIKTLESGQSSVAGLVLPVPWHPAAFPNNPFAANARQKWGGRVNWRTAMAYDATRAIIAGLQQEGNHPELTIEAQRAALQQALRNPAFVTKGSGAQVQFLPTGDRINPPVLVQIQANESGFDFVPATR
jgi:branched-chain amino acid transport system substrate-binding protein